jgi:hypothetical protein
LIEAVLFMAVTYYIRRCYDSKEAVIWTSKTEKPGTRLTFP